MLSHLSIRDFVIVDQIDLDFSPGFTVLTGETGAGKSILIDALSLTMGGRSDSSQVRHHCDRAEVSAIFDISSLPELSEWLAKNSLQGDSDTCLLRRTLDTNSRSRGFINGHTVTLQQLREAGEYLIDIHGQHAHQSLLRPAVQRDLLDAYADKGELVKEVKNSYQHWQRLYQQRIAWEQHSADYQQERELLEWQYRELIDLNFTLEEWQTLQAEHSRLSHTASLLEMAEKGINVLSESETAAISQINVVINQLHHLLDYDNQLKTVLDLLESAQVELQEGIYELKHYQQHLDLDPQRLQQIEERLAIIHAAARKYRIIPDELPDLLTKITDRLSELNAGQAEGAFLESEMTAKKAYLQFATKLTRARTKAAQLLAQQVSASMQTLAMEGGQFSVALLPLEQGNVYGLEQIEFQVSAHKGLPLKPLEKVVSGGELSRISLAIQVITSKIGKAPTLIFDEVDAGIGGRVAEIIGNLLKKLGEERQILCITHLAQVASAGDQQWQVNKLTDQSNTKQVSSRITVLNEQARIEEIARMLGGMKITETTRKHAAEMLRNGAERIK
ncbi:MAG: DNA repair protein RecN [Nitrosomonas sp.]|nr:DNA repair protein RecN [Nitrosomonas sp.]